jgi:hypothetical protein
MIHRGVNIHIPDYLLLDTESYSLFKMIIPIQYGARKDCRRLEIIGLYGLPKCFCY